jgi:hypothetical protein
MPGMLRAAHLLLNALNSPTADATIAGNSQDDFADAQLSLDALFDGGIVPAELLTALSCPFRCCARASRSAL